MKFKDLNSNTITKNILKLKAGESVRGVFRGDLVDFRQHWVNNRSSICTGNATCELCGAGEKSSFRFQVNIIVKENASYVAKVFEQGRSIYEILSSLHADFPLEKNWIKITRNGEGKNTSYTITPVPNSQLSAEDEKQVAAIKLNDLASVQKAMA
jgi:hypothetical protein